LYLKGTFKRTAKICKSILFLSFIVPL